VRSHTIILDTLDDDNEKFLNQYFSSYPGRRFYKGPLGYEERSYQFLAEYSSDSLDKVNGLYYFREGKFIESVLLRNIDWRNEEEFILLRK
jgi:hypothetical protein